jgi:flavin reductase (DIM6/NTAB) family NADH-FMN oxidoreductase RutF
MRKNFGKQSWLYPMPVLIVGSYDEEGRANVMNAAWGGIYDTNMVMVCLSEDHKTTKNIKMSGAFTVSFGTEDTVRPCDYVGIASGNDVPDKVTRAGFHTVKSEFVNAPLIEELPMALECRVIKFNEDGILIGEIVNVSCDECALDEKGEIDPALVKPILYESVHHGYYGFGKKVGQAFSDGAELD